ncbi:MAG TPA: hypothetical protein VF407_10140 [Polyangiaceae bacterium]
MKKLRSSYLLASLALVGAGAIAFASACTTNPVPDAEIAALGDEPGDPGPDHRPGQPCVLCHSAGGPASDDPFAVGGTVFHDPKSAQGVGGVQILFVDSNGAAPKNDVITSQSGNFYVKTSDWDPSFPLFVNIYNPADGTKRVMNSHIGRDPSCATCHHDAFDKASALSAVGHIYMYNATVAPTDAGSGGSDDSGTGGVGGDN